MKLQDAIFNWLQISMVSEARPEDGAAKETKDFFELILREDHKLEQFSYACDEDVCIIEYKQEGELAKVRYDRELAEQLLTDIISNPKYNE
ncbi:hypothetical protein WMW72_17440 [Paenibacillus filicis]|uniref:Uncharacterized protein n=1 Tax=Paenibacillus filicis TaxID=669464 RepID=A0ABU9DLG4_9BACL